LISSRTAACHLLRRGRLPHGVHGGRPEPRDAGPGRVCDISEVTLNGKPLGVRWWGEHRYDTAGALKRGRNVVEVKSPPLFQYVLSLKDDWWPNAGSSRAIASRFPPA